MFESFRFGTFRRLLALFGLRPGEAPPGSPRDPYARKPAPLKPRPIIRSGAVALKEPDTDD